jgi:hypothetical protein
MTLLLHWMLEHPYAASFIVATVAVGVAEVVERVVWKWLWEGPSHGK